MSELIRREDAIKGLEYKRVIMAEADGFGGGYDYEDGQCDAFTESIEFLKRMPTASPWHRVEEPPKEGQNVLTMDANEDMETATYDGEGFEDSYGFYVTDVLYWMPIEPPNEEA